MRPSKLWCDEDTTGIQPGDYFCDCMGTWKVDPDGSWRSYYQLTPEELAECRALALAGAKADSEEAYANSKEYVKSKKEKLVVYLLNIYYTGAGDAGSNSMVPSICASLIDPKNQQSVLEAGDSCTHDDGLTTTKHFELIADKILELLGD